MAQHHLSNDLSGIDAKNHIAEKIAARARSQNDETSKWRVPLPDEMGKSHQFWSSSRIPWPGNIGKQLAVSLTINRTVRCDERSNFNVIP